MMGAHRVAAVLLGVYLAALAVVTFWPSSEVHASSLVWAAEELARLGAPAWVTFTVLELAANVVLFIPLTLLGALVWPGLRWPAWLLIGLAASVFIELGQLIFLPGRTAVVADVLANWLGALLGYLAVALWRRAGRRHSSTSDQDAETRA